MKKHKWIKDIKVLVWDLDKTLSKKNLEIDRIFQKKVYHNLASYLNISFQQAKERFRKRQKKLKGTTISLNSFGLDGYKTMAEVMESINWRRFLKYDEKLILMFKKLDYLKHILLTDNPEIVGLLKLKLLGLNANLFAKRLFAVDLRVTKPDKRLFKMVLNYSNLFPEQHLMIGDREEKDIIPAKKLGARTCLVWGKSKVADISLKTVYDVEKLFI